MWSPDLEGVRAPRRTGAGRRGSGGPVYVRRRRAGCQAALVRSL